jgi:nucleoside triphosphatase
MGGHIEWGETIAATVVREVKEEVGLTVAYDTVIEVAEFVFPKEFHEKRHFIGLQCLCHVVGDAAPHLDYDEIQEARYFPVPQAAALPNLLPATRHTLKVLAEQAK